jgi:hypothetical protein
MRWWTYAIIAIALVAAAPARRVPVERPVHRSELRASQVGAKSSARKRVALADTAVRRASVGGDPAVTPARFELPPPRISVVAPRATAVRCHAPAAVAPAARGPPA